LIPTIPKTLELRQKVQVGKELPPNCKILGDIIGTGGGGGYTKTEDKIVWAQDELRAKAAELGGNYAVMDVTALDKVRVTISGRALLCSAPAPAEAPAGSEAAEPSQEAAPASEEPASPAPAADEQPSAEERLKRLEDLHEKKLITDEEYKKRREEIINSI
jgi:Domain of unknown function (DUF4156)